MAGQNDHSWSKYRVSKPCGLHYIKNRRYLVLLGVWRQPFSIFKFDVLIRYMHFNLNNFSDTVHRLTVVIS